MSRQHLHNEKLLNKHINVRKKIKSFKSDVCLKVFSRVLELTRHYRTHTGEKPFVCQLCDKKFSRKSNLVQHQATHTGKKPFACQFCDRKFAQKSNLVRHQATHSDVRNFKCSICPDGRFFKTKFQLSTHMVYHFEPKFSCSYCDHKSYRKFDLSKNKKTHVEN